MKMKMKMKTKIRSDKKIKIKMCLQASRRLKFGKLKKFDDSLNIKNIHFTKNETFSCNFRILKVIQL